MPSRFLQHSITLVSFERDSLTTSRIRIYEVEYVHAILTTGLAAISQSAFLIKERQFSADAAGWFGERRGALNLLFGRAVNLGRT